MEIFSAEKDIAHLLDNKSVAYTASLKRLEESKYLKPKVNKDFLAKAGVTDSDLYYCTAILVTSCINKNSDCFLPEVIWAARKTPIDKSANLNHEPENIIGHICDSWPIDVDGNIIAEDSEIIDLPSKFHILVSSVIYKLPTATDEYAEKINNLIEKIEGGSSYISMECLFNGFNYGLSKGSEFKIVARNEETSFLTKHMKAYGGTGEYEGYKISRVLKDIQFCAFGFVDNPANEDSIVFTPDEVFDFAKAEIIEKSAFLKSAGVSSNSFNFINEETVIMSDFYQEQNKELKDQNSALAKQVEEIKEQLAKSNVVKLEKEIESLKAEIADRDEAIKAKSDNADKLEAEVNELKAKVDEVTKSNEDLTNKNKELSDTVAKIEAEKITVARKSTLIAGGFSDEDATAKVAKFGNLNDEQFDEVAKELIAAAEMKKKNVKEDKKEEAKAEDVIDADPTDAEVTSAEVKEEDDTDTILSISKHISAALKIQLDKENGDK